MNLNTLQKRQVWVTVPTFNEAENLPRLLAALGALNIDLKVVVVDDASPDGTGEIAEEAARANPNIHVVRRTNERGLGTAYMTGFRYALAAGADAVMTMDCDFSHDPATIPTFIEALDSADIVVGSRYVPGGSTVNWGLHRKILSAAANRFTRALFGIPVKDCTSGFRLYRKEVLEVIPWEQIRSSGYAFLVEILSLATSRAGARVREIPIRFVDRELGTAKMGPREVVRGLFNLLRLKVDLSRRRSGSMAALEEAED